MLIDTTINIKVHLLLRIAEVSNISGISLNKIIAIMINKLIINCPIKPKLFSTVKYQQAGDNIIWHTLHVSLDGDVYEKALDLRKVMKMSVSFLIAKAIELFLDQVIKDLSEDNTDKNSEEYVYISSKCNGLLNFTIFWISPPAMAAAGDTCWISGRAEVSLRIAMVNKD